MPKLAANVSMLFPEQPFLERFAAAAQAGFRAVEYQYPYDWQPAQVAAAARDAGLEVVLHNMPQGDAQRGERGSGRRLDRIVEPDGAGELCPDQTVSAIIP